MGVHDGALTPAGTGVAQWVGAPGSTSRETPSTELENRRAGPPNLTNAGEDVGENPPTFFSIKYTTNTFKWDQTLFKIKVRFQGQGRHLLFFFSLRVPFSPNVAVCSRALPATLSWLFSSIPPGHWALRALPNLSPPLCKCPARSRLWVCGGCRKLSNTVAATKTTTLFRKCLVPTLKILQSHWETFRFTCVLPPHCSGVERGRGRRAV